MSPMPLEIYLPLNSDEAMLPHGGVKQSGWVRPNHFLPKIITHTLTLHPGPFQRTMGSGGVPQNQDCHVRGMIWSRSRSTYLYSMCKSVTKLQRLKKSSFSKSCIYTPVFSCAFIIMRFIVVVGCRQIYEGGRTSKVSAILGSQSSLSLP
jgi:hypothetical protein